jgi:hypothetical protein
MDKKESELVTESVINDPLCYNIALGGNGGDTIPNHPSKEEIKKKHSNWMQENNPTRGRKKPESEIENWRISYVGKYTGENNPNFGSKRNESSKQKMSEAKKQWHKNLSEEEISEIGKKISESNKGKEGYWKDKTNNKHSEWMKENNPMKGKTHTDEVKKRISEANKKPKSEETKRKLSEANRGKKPGNIVNVEIDGIIYESLT